MSDRHPFLSEASAIKEYWALSMDPVFRGRNIRRGDGHAVIVIPGLFGNDLYLTRLRHWLNRIGYRACGSGMLLNAGCPQRLLEEVERSVDRSLKNDTGPVSIIGHSRGGMLGKAIANRLGERVTCFIALGSPVGGILRAGPASLMAMAKNDPNEPSNVAADGVVKAGRSALTFFDPDCDTPHCGCAYLDDLMAPLPASTRSFAIYSTEDTVVSPAACPIDGATNIEVSGSHSGLVWNRQVYPHLATALAGP